MNRFRFDSDGMRRGMPYFLTSLAAGLIGAFLILLAVKFTGLGPALVTPPETQNPGAPPPAAPISLNQYEKTTIDVVNKVGPSVVMITTSTIIEDYDFFIGPERKNIQGLGSGVVFRKDGYIVTNNHVVNGQQGMADKILVIVSDGKTANTYPAKIVGVDSQTDLAVLKIDHRNLPVPEWGDSNQVQVGQVAIAIGNPLAENLKNTVTVGVISAKGRNIQISKDLQLRNMLQTDASINPGNSGGPLLNSSGNVVGINSAIIYGSQGIGFAIPSNTVKMVAEQLIDKGYVSRPGLGIAYVHFTKQNAVYLERSIRHALPVAEGIFIAKVLRNSPADKAGLKPGDIVVEINGERVKGEDLIQKLNYPIGAKVKLKYFRDQALRETVVTVGEMRK